MAFPPATISLFILVLVVTLSLSVSAKYPNPNLNPNHNLPSLFHDHNPIFPIHQITDIHDLLPQYGLPKGLLPNNVDSYTLSDDGTFEIILEHSCYVHFDQLVYYEKVVKGKLKYGCVSDVSGIQAKKLFLWVSVTGMDADTENDMIEFHVGVLSEKLPAKQFDSVPTCKNKASSSSS